MKHKKLWAVCLTLALMLIPGLMLWASADGTTTTYTLTIPATLNVANSDWNDAGGISATGTLASGKKLTVTASSANSWALKSGDNSVGYKLATTSSDTEATTSWEFTELSSTATTKPMGIIVEDYSDKPAGTYQDTVTFTASVENAAPAALARLSDAFSFTWDSNSFMPDLRANGDLTDMLCPGDRTQWPNYLNDDQTLKYTLTEDEAKSCAEYLGDKSIVVYDSYTPPYAMYKYVKNDNGSISTGESEFAFGNPADDYSEFNGFTFYICNSAG